MSEDPIPFRGVHFTEELPFCEDLPTAALVLEDSAEGLAPMFQLIPTHEGAARREEGHCLAGCDGGRRQAETEPKLRLDLTRVRTFNMIHARGKRARRALRADARQC